MKNTLSFAAGLLFVVLLAFSMQAAATNAPSEEQAWINCYDYIGGPSNGAGMYCEKNAGNLTIYARNSNGSQAGNWVYPAGTECPVGTEFSTETMTCVEPPPTCDAPNYIDVVSGECLPPEEICFTTLESMAEECVYISFEDPDPGLNCVNDSTGKEICLNDDPQCFTIDGQTACPEPDNVCGWKNGTYSCVDPIEEGCGYFNGEKVCTTPDGDIIDSDSPDHPDNGGNLDGDNTNDPTDPRDPIDGGDPDNQPNEPINTVDSDRASEQTARNSLGVLKDIKKNTNAASSALKDMAANGIKTNLEDDATQADGDAIIQNGATGSWDDPGTGTWAEFDQYGNEIAADGGEGYGSAMLDGIAGTTTGLIEQGTCANLGFVFKGHDFSLTCDKTKKIRDLLSWVFYLLTVWFLFDIITSPTTRQK